LFKKIIKISLILLVITVLLSTTLLGTISVNAADVETYPYLSVFPNPVGVGDNVVVGMSVQPLQPASYDFYQGYSVTITKPDGTTETKGPFTSDATGSTWFNYQPTQVGTYSLKFSYPGQIMSNGDNYKPATSPVTELVVQEESIPGYPSSSLPTDYWTRPISADNWNWGSISGNWLQDSYDSQLIMAYCSSTGYNPYSQAPMTAHIVWTKELLLGGLVGGEYDSTSYYTLNDYETGPFPPIIINGRLYYNYHESDFRTQIRPGFVCVDLRTGEELWRNTEGNINIGQLYDYRSGNQQGATPWLWDIGLNYLLGPMHLPHTYKMYDAFTGELVLSFENAMQGGAPVFSENGELIVYYIDSVNNWLLKWNQTQAFEANGLITYSGSGVGFLRPSQPWSFFPNIEGTYDWNTGIQWNVTIPDVPEYPDLEYGGFLHQIIESIQGDVLFSKLESFSESYLEMGFDANTGQRLWIHDTEKWTWSRAFGEGYYADFYSPSMTWTGYDVTTGAKLWETDPQGYPWGLYQGAATLIADGKLLAPAYDGYVHAYDITTGERVWKHYSEDTTETPYGTYPFYYGPMMAQGVIFAGTGEHSPSQPLIRGNKLHAIDAETGEGIWSVAGLHNLAAIADGYLLTANGYDNKIYCFGKGPSETTVTAPDVAVTLGDSIMIKGTVTDQSTGAMGTPAISDEDMTEWMEYIYMQKLKPADAKGVEVSIDVIDSNGNYRNIGTATSDMSGTFGYMWTPDIPGQYTVMATFAGSESYGSSYAQTYLGVVDAPDATPPPEATPAPMTDTYVLGMGAAGLVAIIAIGLVLIMMMRKK